MFELVIQTLYKGELKLKFTNFENFVCIAGHQIGILRGYIDDPQSYLNEVSKDFEKRFQERESLGVYKNLTKDSIILDIGSGVGILDMLLYLYLDGGKFYLLDKDEVNHDHTVAHWSEGHGWYNDWSVLEDIIACSDISRENFVLLDPQMQWPNNTNLINSTYSYLWHYPLDTYWSKIQQQNASLCFDILNRSEDNKSKISKYLNKECKYTDKPQVAFHWFKKDLILEDGSPGKVCYWQ